MTFKSKKQHKMIKNKTNPLTAQPSSHSVPEQKIITLNKFIILNIFSFGFYQLCWIFKAWRFFLQKDNLDIKIAARTGFSIFYLYPLFLKISNYAFQQNKKYDLKSLLMYLAIVIMCLLPEPLSYISILSFVFFIPAFRQLNHAKINDDQFVTTEQNKFSISHKITISVGAILWILIIFSIIWAIFQESS